MNLSECRDALKIDRNALDEMLVKQAQIFHDVSLAFAMAVSRRDKAHEDMRRVEAAVSSKIRIRLEKDDEKVTEARVKADCMKDAAFMAARDADLVATQTANEWEALKESFKQRSYMLSELAGLYVAGYWGHNATVKDPHAGDRRISDTEYEVKRQRLADKRQEKKNG